MKKATLESSSPSFKQTQGNKKTKFQMNRLSRAVAVNSFQFVLVDFEYHTSRETLKFTRMSPAVLETE